MGKPEINQLKAYGVVTNQNNHGLSRYELFWNCPDWNPYFGYNIINYDSNPINNYFVSIKHCFDYPDMNKVVMNHL